MLRTDHGWRTATSATTNLSLFRKSGGPARKRRRRNRTSRTKFVGRRHGRARAVMSRRTLVGNAKRCFSVRQRDAPRREGTGRHDEAELVHDDAGVRLAERRGIVCGVVLPIAVSTRMALVKCGSSPQMDRSIRSAKPAAPASRMPHSARSNERMPPSPRMRLQVRQASDVLGGLYGPLPLTYPSEVQPPTARNPSMGSTPFNVPPPRVICDSICEWLGRPCPPSTLPVHADGHAQRNAPCVLRACLWHGGGDTERRERR